MKPTSIKLTLRRSFGILLTAGLSLRLAAAEPEDPPAADTPPAQAPAESVAVAEPAPLEPVPPAAAATWYFHPETAQRLLDHGCALCALGLLDRCDGLM